MTPQTVIQTINSVLGLSLSPTDTPLEASLKSLGIDSLDVFNVLVELEGVTGKKVPDEDVEKLSTIQRLADYFS